jgi:hypothetical protein
MRELHARVVDSSDALAEEQVLASAEPNPSRRRFRRFVQLLRNGDRGNGSGDR